MAIEIKSHIIKGNIMIFNKKVILFISQISRTKIIILVQNHMVDFSIIRVAESIKVWWHHQHNFCLQHLHFEGMMSLYILQLFIKKLFLTYS